ncbi:hypothetical protein W822_09600 [Advenella kashmirensis W13003]|uniref:Uncharacterized protein n=1 Tax=Advenella kashmirensis W13003 TaxID=1424334 RepID=V8QW09_9BURK|nr:hypothetical protein W822_09600 [Advenella kashmirensis W13003]
MLRKKRRKGQSGTPKQKPIVQRNKGGDRILRLLRRGKKNNKGRTLINSALFWVIIN